eukprot:jgi/Tetstr1/432609/TSEL_021978.t1
MHIDKRSKIVMKPPKFKCDVKIHPQIQSPLPDKSFFMTLIGSAGSGKTSLMVNMLRSPQMYFQAFKHVHLVKPPHSLASLDVKIFKKHDKTYPDLDWATLDKIHEKTREAADEEEFSLLVIDDMAAALKDSEIQRLMKLLIYNRRHLRLSIIMLVQSFNTIPLPVRKTISNFAMLKFKNKREYEAIFKELIFLDPHTADNLMRFVFRESNRKAEPKKKAAARGGKRKQGSKAGGRKNQNVTQNVTVRVSGGRAQQSGAGFAAAGAAAQGIGVLGDVGKKALSGGGVDFGQAKAAYGQVKGGMHSIKAAYQSGSNRSGLERR